MSFKIFMPDELGHATYDEGDLVHWPKQPPSYSDVFYSGQSLSNQHQKLVRTALYKSYHQAARHLSLAPINVRVFVDRNNLSLPENITVGGFAAGPHEILIPLRPELPYFGNVKDFLPSTTVHELHHIKRMQIFGLTQASRGVDNPLYGNVGRALISEGLAVKFEEEIGHNRYIYKDSPNAVPALAEDAKANSEKPYSHCQDWFIKEPYAGYELGYRIVSHWLDATHQTASKAVGIKAEEVLEWWKEAGYPLETRPPSLSGPRKTLLVPVQK